MMNKRRTVEITKNADETRALAQAIAGRLEAGDLITLQGELGAGKTTFVQGLARGLDVPQEATSPTFVLILEYEGRLPVLHLDAYRLTNRSGEPICYDALRDAGVLDLLEREDAVKLVEWPERIADALPTARFAITISSGDTDDERQIEIIERIEKAA
jgi:tRNA threonylcarbamoyladenosine biosynthesis protein TsaE